MNYSDSHCLKYFQNGFTSLHVACKKNRYEVVELLLSHKANKEALTEVRLSVSTVILIIRLPQKLLQFYVECSDLNFLAPANH